MLLMLYKGELCATKREQLRSVGNYPNIERLMVYLQTAFPIGIEKLEDQDKRLFQNVYHLTSASKFLQAVKDKNFELAREVAVNYPFAVRASEATGKNRTAAHIAASLQDFEMLTFFETLPHFDFDLPDNDGESPLFIAICKKNLEMVKFFVKKGADLNRRSISNLWSVVYIAATLGNTETLEYLISLGCEVNF